MLAAKGSAFPKIQIVFYVSVVVVVVVVVVV